MLRDLRECHHSSESVNFHKSHAAKCGLEGGQRFVGMVDHAIGDADDPRRERGIAADELCHIRQFRIRIEEPAPEQGQDARRGREFPGDGKQLGAGERGSDHAAFNIGRDRAGIRGLSTTRLPHRLDAARFTGSGHRGPHDAEQVQGGPRRIRHLLLGHTGSGKFFRLAAPVG